jgi:hypothetical protein
MALQMSVGHEVESSSAASMANPLSIARDLPDDLQLSLVEGVLIRLHEARVVEAIAAQGDRYVPQRLQVSEIFSRLV